MPTRTRFARKIESAGYQEKRRGRRMNSRVPVRLEWTGPDGAEHEVQAHTRVVNPYGCLVVLRENLSLDQSVTLTNLATQQSNSATVVWRGNERPEGWEYGIEMTNPEMDFWGLEL
jgi:hypothetical protein